MEADLDYIKVGSRVTVQYGKKWRKENAKKMYYMDGTIKHWDASAQLCVVVFDDEGESWESRGEMHLKQVKGKIFNDFDGFAVKVTKQKSTEKKNKRFKKAALKLSAILDAGGGERESKGEEEKEDFLNREPRSLIEERKMRKEARRRKLEYEKKKAEEAALKAKEQKEELARKVAADREARDRKFVEAEERRLAEKKKESEEAAKAFEKRRREAEAKARKEAKEKEDEKARVEAMLEQGGNTDIAATLARERKRKEEAALALKMAAGRLAKMRLKLFYAEHSPQMVDKVTVIAGKYAGREERLYAALEKKYGAPVPPMTLEELEAAEREEERALREKEREEEARKARIEEEEAEATKRAIEEAKAAAAAAAAAEEAPIDSYREEEGEIREEEDEAEVEEEEGPDGVIYLVDKKTNVVYNHNVDDPQRISGYWDPEVCQIVFEKDAEEIEEDEAEVEEEEGPDGVIYLVDKMNRIVYTHDVNDPHPVGRWDEKREVIVLGDPTMQQGTGGDYDYEYEYEVEDDIKSARDLLEDGEAEVEEEVGPDGKMYLVDKHTCIVYNYDVDEPQPMGRWDKKKETIVLGEEPSPEEILEEEELKRTKISTARSISMSSARSATRRKDGDAPEVDEEEKEIDDEDILELATTREKMGLLRDSDGNLIADINTPLADFDGELARLQKISKLKREAEKQREIQEEIDFEINLEFKKRTFAATQMQSVIRGHHGRVKVKALRLKIQNEHECAQKIQSLHRGNKGRKRYRSAKNEKDKFGARSYPQLEESATQMQRLVRGRFAQRDAALLRHKNRKQHLAIIKIQSGVRKKEAKLRVNRIKAQNRKNLENYSATIIQAQFRGGAGRRRFEAIRKEKHWREHGYDNPERKKAMERLGTYGKDLSEPLQLSPRKVREKEDKAKMIAKYGRTSAAISLLLSPTDVEIDGVPMKVSAKIIKVSGDTIIEAEDLRPLRSKKSVLVISGPDVRRLVTDKDPELLAAERGGDRVLALCQLVSYDGKRIFLSQKSQKSQNQYQNEMEEKLGSGMRQRAVSSHGNKAVGLLPDIIEDDTFVTAPVTARSGHSGISASGRRAKTGRSHVSFASDEDSYSYRYSEDDHRGDFNYSKRLLEGDGGGGDEYEGERERMYRLGGESRRAGGVSGSEWGRHGEGLNALPSYEEQMSARKSFRSKVYPEITPESPRFDVEQDQWSRRSQSRYSGRSQSRDRPVSQWSGGSDRSYRDDDEEDRRVTFREQMDGVQGQGTFRTPRPMVGKFGQGGRSGRRRVRGSNAFPSPRNDRLSSLDRAKQEQMRMLQKTMAAANIQEKRRMLMLKSCTSRHERLRLEKKYAKERARAETDIMKMLSLTRLDGVSEFDKGFDEENDNERTNFNHPFQQSQKSNRPMSRQGEKPPYKLKDLLHDALLFEKGRLTSSGCRLRTSLGKPIGNGRKRKQEIINKTWDALNLWMQKKLEKRRGVEVPFFGKFVWKKVVPGSKYHKSITLTDVPPLPKTPRLDGDGTTRRKRRRRKRRKVPEEKETAKKKYKEIDPGDVRIFRPVFEMNDGFRNGHAPQNAAKLNRENRKVGFYLARRAQLKTEIVEVENVGKTKDKIEGALASSPLSGRVELKKKKRRKKKKKKEKPAWDVDNVLYALIDLFTILRQQYRRGRHLQIEFDVGIFHAKRPLDEDGYPMDTTRSSARSGYGGGGGVDTSRSVTFHNFRKNYLDYTFQFDEDVVEIASGAGRVELTPKEVDQKLRELYKKYPPNGFVPCGQLYPPEQSRTVRNHDKAVSMRKSQRGNGSTAISGPYPAPFKSNFMVRI
eukprot:g3406.t1